MSKESNLLSEIGIFLAGVIAAGFLTSRRRDPAPAQPVTPSDASSAQDWHSAIAALESRLAAQESANAARFGQLESRLEEQGARLAEVPTTQQIVGAMEHLIGKTMNSLDERLTTQAHSIEVLKTTVSQTDSLLERVLESLDSLQPYTESLDVAEDPLLQRQAV
jgi:uncharacterized coiled-coil protein SlyX